MSIELFLTAANLVIAYAIVANRLFAFARPLRDECAELAGSFLPDERIPEWKRLAILQANEGMTSAVTAWRAVYFLLVVIVEMAFAAVRRLFVAACAQSVASSEIPEDRRRDYARLVRLSILGSLCTSPAALVLFGLIISLASFAVSGLRLCDFVLSHLGAHLERGDTGDCPPTPVG